MSSGMGIMSCEATAVMTSMDAAKRESERLDSRVAEAVVRPKGYVHCGELD